MGSVARTLLVYLLACLQVWGFPRSSLSDAMVEAMTVVAWDRRVDTVLDNPLWYKVRSTPIPITGQTRMAVSIPQTGNLSPRAADP